MMLKDIGGGLTAMRAYKVREVSEYGIVYGS